ncbi:MgtC/SapB family protein [Qipengyuania sp. JC766]|uniref:MgtC/SapB family protein n=1 Tax=Qipengyuania sp. JC766 TaxID=3232139 RepID=UPI003457FE72
MLNESLLTFEILPEAALRLGVATGVGMLLGFERETDNHPAGVRTHAVIALSAALVMLTAILLTGQLDPQGQRMDVLRVIEGMATAAGIIGAGLIVFKQGNIRNLTTAAHIWLTATIGIACGAGQYVLVGLAAALGLFVMLVVKRLEKSATHLRD